MELRKAAASNFDFRVKFRQSFGPTVPFVNPTYLVNTMRLKRPGR